MTSIGIDIGGTSTRVGAVDDDGRVIAKSDFSTPIGEGRSAFVVQLAQHIGELHRLTTSDTPIGIAVPGLVDKAPGIVTRSVNVPFLDGASVCDLLPSERAAQALLMTDIEAATWAEYRAHGKADARFVHLRIGTGAGCGVIDGGAYVQPPRATPGHADVLIVDDRPDAARCPCGQRGCLELFVSRRALSQKIETKEVMDEARAWLTKALAQIAEQFKPTVICLGGGVVDAWPQLVHGAMPTHLAVLGDDAGIIGAASLAPSPSGRGLG